MSFKVGDRVRIHKPNCTMGAAGIQPSWMPEMDKYDGEIVTLDYKTSNEYWHIKETFWVFGERWMKLVKGEGMRKEDLQNGDVVKLRNGAICVVAHNDLLEEDGNRLGLDPFRDDLTNGGFVGKELDIMRVCKKPPFPFDFYNERSSLLLWDWERKEAKEVTMAEVEEKFGCKVKIIKGDNE